MRFKLTYSETTRYVREIEAETEAEAIAVWSMDDNYTSEYHDETYNNDDLEVTEAK